MTKDTLSVPHVVFDSPLNESGLLNTVKSRGIRSTFTLTFICYPFSLESCHLMNAEYNI